MVLFIGNVYFHLYSHRISLMYARKVLCVSESGIPNEALLSSIDFLGR